MTKKLLARPAVDIVIVMVTFIIGALLLITAVAVVLIELIQPETDTSDLIRMESEILGVLVGALVGVIGGRGIGKAETYEAMTNGVHDDEDGT